MGKVHGAISYMLKTSLMKADPSTELGKNVIALSSDIAKALWQTKMLVSPIVHGKLNYMSIGGIKVLERLLAYLKSIQRLIGNQMENGGMTMMDKKPSSSTTSTEELNSPVSLNSAISHPCSSPLKAASRSSSPRESSAPVTRPLKIGTQVFRKKSKKRWPDESQKDTTMRD